VGEKLEDNINNPESRGFISRSRSKPGWLLTGLALVSMVFSQSGCIFTRAYRQRIIGEVKRPTPMTVYLDAVSEVIANRQQITKDYGLTDPNNNINYNHFADKTKEMLEADLTKRHLPYSIEQLQAVYGLLKTVKKDDSSKIPDINGLERKTVEKLMRYHVRIAGEAGISDADAYRNYLAAAFLALDLNDKKAFKEIYKMLLPYRNKKNIREGTIDQISVVYHDVYERAIKKWAKDRRNARIWSVVFAAAAVYGITAVGSSSAGSAVTPGSGGGPGTIVPGGG